MQFWNLPTHGHLVARSPLRRCTRAAICQWWSGLIVPTLPSLLMKRFLLIALFSSATFAQSPADSAETAPKVIAEAFGQLSATLAEAIAKDGPAKALSVCSERAPQITAEVSKSHGVTLRRASDKPRNPKNKPTVFEQAFLTAFAKALAAQEAPKPQTLTNPDGSISYFAPIVLGNPLCLKCHGSPEKDIAAETLTAIRTSYPDDKATGYQLGQLRGLWHVIFPAKSTQP